MALTAVCPGRRNSLLRILVSTDNHLVSAEAAQAAEQQRRRQQLAAALLVRPSRSPILHSSKLAASRTHDTRMYQLGASS